MNKFDPDLHFIFKEVATNINFLNLNLKMIKVVANPHDKQFHIIITQTHCANC